MTSLTGPQQQILRSAVFAGALERENVIGYDGADLDADLLALAEKQLIAEGDLVLPTDDGQALLEKQYMSLRASLPEEARDEIIRQFRPLDREVKLLAAKWQNADARNDWEEKVAVIEKLSALQQKTLSFISRYRSQLPNLSEFGAKLGKALAHVLEGETDFVVGVRCPSYHTVWFEMHEDLLRTLQRERDAE
ncbi:MAG: hypothetical protein WA910_08135 [Sphingopyxis granuli]